MLGRSLLLSFRDAFRGIGYVVGTQRNARIQWGIGLAALVTGGIFACRRGIGPSSS